MRKLPLRIALLVATVTMLFSNALWADGPMRKLAFYEVHETRIAPNADGTLPAAAWEKASVASTFYEYWKPNPILGQLKTEFRMLFNDGGIYLKIINYEANLDKVRATLTSRDDPQLWTDDSAQIYFDPQASGVGYVNFTVNSLGTLADMRRLDAAVVLYDWSGTQWHAKTSKVDGAWIIEAFFPWSDLGKKARQGDIWMFDHVRYAWSTGKFVGVTWAPGGNYTSPSKFGYLHFAGNEEPAPLVTGKTLSHVAQGPWVLPMDTGLLLCSATGEVRFSSAADTIAGYRAELQKAAVRALAPSEQHPESRQRLLELQNGVVDLKYETSAQALDAVERISQVTAEVNDIYWRTSTENLINNTAKGPPQ